MILYTFIDLTNHLTNIILFLDNSSYSTMYKLIHFSYTFIVWLLFLNRDLDMWRPVVKACFE